jgi:hypothetical protein
LRRRKIGVQCFPWGTCKFPEANEPKVPQPTWFALNNSGTMFVPKNLSPFALGKHVSLGWFGSICLGKLYFHNEFGPTYFSRNLGPFVQGNHVSLGEIHNCSSRTIILPSCMKTIHDENFHWKNMWTQDLPLKSWKCRPFTSHCNQKKGE